MTYIGEQEEGVKRGVVSVVMEGRHGCPAAGCWRHNATAWLWVWLTASRWAGPLVVGRGRRIMKWWYCWGSMATVWGSRHWRHTHKGRGKGEKREGVLWIFEYEGRGISLKTLTHPFNFIYLLIYLFIYLLRFIFLRDSTKKLTFVAPTF